jgi:GR25 family glycosyltransferase involved in LPS biosynthesis
MTNYPIYCINLEHRKDRKIHSLNQFKKIGLSHDKIIYLHFIKDINGGVYGCFDSHIKVWNDFFKKYPNQKYALIFEDDFVFINNSESIIKNADEFINNNYDNIDILFLHNTCIDIENKINNNLFTNGYGLMAHAYFITRNYIQSIISKYGKLPEPNGWHIDFEINMNIVCKDNMIYTKKIFYTKEKYVKQIVDESNNYINIIDKLMRTDINKHINDIMKIMKLLRKTLLNDIQVQELFYIIIRTITPLNNRPTNNFHLSKINYYVLMFLVYSCFLAMVIIHLLFQYLSNNLIFVQNL